MGRGGFQPAGAVTMCCPSSTTKSTSYNMPRDFNQLTASNLIQQLLIAAVLTSFHVKDRLLVVLSICRPSEETVRYPLPFHGSTAVLTGSGLVLRSCLDCLSYFPPLVCSKTPHSILVWPVTYDRHGALTKKMITSFIFL